jgi:hypothetical protein
MISIVNLPKARVLAELFNNVYQKSSIAKIEFERLSTICHATGSIPGLGLYDLLTEQDGLSVLQKSYKVQTIGTVQINIDFTNDEIDTDGYDLLHKTNEVEDVLPAAQCIEYLREKLEQERIEADEQKLKEIDLFDSQATTYEKIRQAEELLKTFLANDKIIFTQLSTSEESFTIDIEGLQLTDELAGQFAKKLVDCQMGVRYEKSSDYGIFKSSAQLSLLEPIDSIIQKVTAAKANEKRSWCVIL